MAWTTYGSRLGDWGTPGGGGYTLEYGQITGSRTHDKLGDV